MYYFSLTLFDEKKRQIKEDRLSIEETLAPEVDAPEETGDETKAPDAGEQATEEVDFDALIQGKYKEAFQEKVQAIINRRFKAAKALEERWTETEPILKLLADRYGIEDSSPKALLAAVNGDESFFKTAADQQGYTPEQYRHVRELERQVAKMQMEQERSTRAREAKEAYESWARDVGEIQKDYPEFSLADEMKNPDFTSLLRAGVGLRAAYEALHIGDIKQRVAENAHEQAAEEFRTRSERPRESGADGGTGLRIARDIGKLTREQRQEIARRAARGEKIQF